MDWIWTSTPHPPPRTPDRAGSKFGQNQGSECLARVRDRKGTPKNLCDKDFAELSGELSDAICLKTLVFLGSAIDLFRKFFGAVRAILWLCGSFLAQCTLVPVFDAGEHPHVPLFRLFEPGEHPNVPSFRFSVQGNIRQNHPFGNHPFANPRPGHLKRRAPRSSLGMQLFRSYRMSLVTESLPHRFPPLNDLVAM